MCELLFCNLLCFCAYKTLYEYLNLSGESSMVNAADIFIVDQDHMMNTFTNYVNCTS